MCIRIWTYIHTHIPGRTHNGSVDPTCINFGVQLRQSISEVGGCVMGPTGKSSSEFRVRVVRDVSCVRSCVSARRYPRGPPLAAVPCPAAPLPFPPPPVPAHFFEQLTSRICDLRLPKTRQFTSRHVPARPALSRLIF